MIAAVEDIHRSRGRRRNEPVRRGRPSALASRAARPDRPRARARNEVRHGTRQARTQARRNAQEDPQARPAASTAPSRNAYRMAKQAVDKAGELRLPRPPRRRSASSAPLDRPHQRRGAAARPLLQPLIAGLKARRLRARPQGPGRPRGGDDPRPSPTSSSRQAGAREGSHAEAAERARPERWRSSRGRPPRPSLGSTRLACRARSARPRRRVADRAGLGGAARRLAGAQAGTVRELLGAIAQVRADERQAYGAGGQPAQGAGRGGASRRSTPSSRARERSARGAPRRVDVTLPGRRPRARQPPPGDARARARSRRSSASSATASPRGPRSRTTSTTSRP